MLKVSRELRRRIFERRIVGERQYQIAHRAGLNPSLVSHLLNNSIQIQPADARVLRLADAVGVPPDRAIENCSEIGPEAA